MERSEARSGARWGETALTKTLGALALAAALALTAQAPGAQAQDGEEALDDALALGGAAAPDALATLFEQLRVGEADPHLPFVLARLNRALADQDLLSVLELIEPEYFNTQFAAHAAAPGRTPGATLGAFACELFAICDISKTYSFNDIVSSQVIAVSPPGGLTGGQVEVTLELRMWDGLTVQSVIFYNTATAKLSGPVG